MDNDKVIRIGSRASRLAVIQSEIIMQEIHKVNPLLKLELVTMKTTGDKILNKTLDKIGGKGLFLKELDEALMSGRVDICVHSLKDVPVQENPDYPIKAYSSRELPYDVLVFPKGKNKIDKSLPVGCSSARRILQFKNLYPDIDIKPVRGNVLTRLEKLDSGQYSALILAEAGLARLGLQGRISYRFSPDEIIPAAGQGIIAVQTRAGEFDELMMRINNRDSEIRAKTERYLSKALGGDCSSPIASYSEIENNKIILRGFFEDNGNTFSCSLSGDIENNIYIAEKLAGILKNKVKR
jgi:hydroxymethylbilane synthase